MNKQIIIGLLVGGLVAFVGFWFGSPRVQVIEAPVENPAFGALSGPDVQSYLNVHGWLAEGGGKTTVTPSNASYTLTFGDMAESNIITFSASTTMPALTVTLPASTTLPIPNEVGATRRWKIENPFTAAATTTTIAAGAGIDLQVPDGQNVVIGINNYAWLTCTYGLDSGAPQDSVCLLVESVPAD